MENDSYKTGFKLPYINDHILMSTEQNMIKIRETGFISAGLTQ